MFHYIYIYELWWNAALDPRKLIGKVFFLLGSKRILRRKKSVDIMTTMSKYKLSQRMNDVWSVIFEKNEFTKDILIYFQQIKNNT